MPDPRTLIDPVACALPPVAFSDDRGQWSEVTAATLSARAATLAARLAQAVPGDGTGRVALAMASGPDLLAGLIAAWRLQAGVTVLCHRIGQESGLLPPATAAAMLTHLAPHGVLCDGPRLGVLGELDLPATTSLHLVPQDTPPAAAAARQMALPEPGTMALYNFTSGTSGRPRLVAITHDQLRANIRTIAQRSLISPMDHYLAWLPLYHDLGLVSLLANLSAGVRCSVMAVEAFLANPFSWLKAIDQRHATVSAAPPSALALLARFAQARALAGVDLSRLRGISLGGEPIAADALTGFVRAFRGHGFADLSRLTPCYGLAEAVLGVSGGTALDMPRLLTVSARALGRERRLVPVPGDDREHPSVTLVSCGPPAPTVEVRIADAAGQPLGEGQVGRILIRGATVVDRYWGEAPDLEAPGPDSSDPDAPAPHAARWRDTGDLGAMVDGELVPCGRARDILIRGGHNFAPEPLEAAVVTALEGVARLAAYVAIQRPGLSGDHLVLLVEVRKTVPEDLAARATAAVLAAGGPAPDAVQAVRHGELPVTTSGKLQRALIRQWLQEQPATAAAPSPDAATAPTRQPVES